MNHYNISNFEFNDKNNNKVVFTPILSKSGVPLFLVNGKLCELSELSELNVSKGMKTPSKAYRLYSINDQIFTDNIVVQFYVCRNLRKSKHDVFKFIKMFLRDKWWENKNKQTIRSPTSNINYTIEPIFEGESQKNNTPERGRTTNKFLVLQINGIDLDVPFETKFRVIDEFIQGFKKYIMRPKGERIVECITCNKKSVFRQISHNKFLVIKYKDNRLEHKNIIINYDSIKAFQCGDSKNIPKLEKIINPCYVSIQELALKNMRKKIFYAKEKYPEEFRKRFNGSRIGKKDIEDFISQNTKTRNMGRELECDICSGISETLSKNNLKLKAIKTNSPFESDIKVGNFFIESKLDYSSAPMLHMTVQFDQNGYVHGSRRFMELKNNSSMVNFYQSLYYTMHKVLDNSENFQKLKLNLQKNGITFNTLRQGLINMIDRFEYDKNLYLNNHNFADVQVIETMRAVQKYSNRPVNSFTEDDKLYYLYIMYISTTNSAHNFSRYTNIKSRKIISEIITNKTFVSEFLDVIYEYMYNVNHVRYIQIGQDTFIMDENEDPLGLVDLYKIPPFKKSFSAVKIDININRDMNRFRLDVRLIPSRKNNIHFNHSLDGVRIEKVNIKADENQENKTKS